ncbi:hypothetical protein FTUN_5187 [Frigoriglobus tundricola]|uniref:Uncharacterized protein n=1 Tax=Frigoriglobus tundricola TaxID=2774151 RepID=A0A6M5YXD5_9BACT|nr:hypothetical protein FTUN_5187 [Frigoriglobus tundricola]
MYGLRAARGMVDGVDLSGVIDFPADALKDFLTVPDLKFDASRPVRAFRPAADATGSCGRTCTSVSRRRRRARRRRGASARTAPTRPGPWRGPRKTRCRWRSSPWAG